MSEEFKSPIPKEPSNLSGQWIGGGNAVGAVINYETPGWSASGFAVHDFKNQAGRVGAGGSYSAYKPTPNSDISVVGNYSRSYGNARPNPDAYVGMRYTMNF